MEVILSDESVNMYGFRVLTSGIDLSAFEKNPIMLYDHARRKEYDTNKNIILPIGRWNDVQKLGGQLIGTPEFDVEDKFAAEIARKFEKGFLNAASINMGFDAIEWSEDPALMLQGQTGPTIVKCKIREISITDIPGNYNSVRLSCAGRELALNGATDPKVIKEFFSPSINLNEPQMKKVILLLNATGLAGQLPETATEELVAAGVSAITGALSAKEQEITSLTKEIGELKAAAQTAKVTALKDKATSLVEGALSAKKIIAEQKEPYIALASATEEGYESVKKLLDNAKPHMSVSGQLNAGGNAPADQDTPTALKAEFTKRANANDGEPNLEDLKTENLERFKLVYKAGTGKDFKA